ncbi:MAG: Xaa-Pro peptidase family protein [Candidatus Woesearchaeota archaeon]|jgi:Xaa-Pro aminopeptidase|nr:Xaa-Pro peptidase family protein [Candidatus Woesearchaeota archaeon]MDP7180911.1 Xaa-Pro peptidase family protein [Candidatus Woesearchaeota archaeon]MDP7199152.1 Xaa-Pro peptidase family protein [Candidatus Woesearchaeota archaeon]MDP7467585.1 Xaa-Pro peptidase family protein [Candidatus Woesearchaeota archaeon]MDP7647067.1 Xaa-Pro peptidase family protein [Candidatus Woesearchaeota archaeon]
MRVKELQAILKKKGLDSAVFLTTSEKPDPNVLYFTQLHTDISCLVVTKKEVFHFVPGFEYERMKKENVLHTKNWWKDIKKVGGKKIGINETVMSVAEQEKLHKFATSKPISKDLFALRAKKTAEEQDRVRKACMLTDSIWRRLLLSLPKLNTELDIVQWLEKEIKQAGLRIAFPPVVASGGNAQHPHHEAKNELQPGFCVIDFGVVYQGYMSDMTRTIHLGTPSFKDRALYNKVLKTQQACIKKVQKGVKLKELTEFAKKRLGKQFIHGIGHGVGVEIHEPLDKLKPGMVLTIEPGVYGQGRGIRIEDTVLVTVDGVEVLTASNREIFVL